MVGRRLQYHGFTYLYRLVLIAEPCWSLENNTVREKEAL